MDFDDTAFAVKGEKEEFLSHPTFRKARGTSAALDVPPFRMPLVDNANGVGFVYERL